MCSTDLEQREREHTERMDCMRKEGEQLEAEIQMWTARTEALKEEEVELVRERRRLQQQERQILKEKERMKRKLCL